MKPIDVNEQIVKEERYLRAKKRVKEITGFYWHLFWYLAVNIGMLTLIYSKLSAGETLNFGHFATAFFWGIGLLGHWAGVFGVKMLFTKNWEERKIKELMDKDRF